MTDEVSRDAPVLTPGQRATGRNAMETVVFRLLILPAGLATMIVTTRYLQPSGRGAYVWALLTATLMAALVGNIGTAYAHAFRQRPEERDALLRVALLLALGAGAIAGIALVPIDLALAPDGYGISFVVAVGVPAIVVSQALSGALLALGRTRAWNIVQALPPLAGLVTLIVLVVGLDYGLTAALLGWCTAQALAATAAAICVRDHLRPLRFPRGASAEMWKMLSFALRVGAANLVALLNYRIEFFVLEANRGVRAVGIYSLSASLAELTWVVSAALAAAIIAPVVTRSDRDAAATIARAGRHALVLGVISASVLAIMAPVLVPVVFGPPFRASITPLLLLLPGVVMFAPASILAIWFLLRLGRTRYAIGLGLFSTLVTFGAAVALIPSYGANGAAIATTVGYGITMILSYVLFIRTAPVRLGDFVPGRVDLDDYRALSVSFRRAVGRILTRRGRGQRNG